ncbi:MAG: SDR family oxidoreductase [Archangium sp.]
MHVFVTGASGFVGSAVVRELLRGGHRVTGLARSEKSAAAVEQLGAAVLRGDLNDLDSLKRGARDAEAVIHTAYNHDDFSKLPAAGELDLRAVEAMSSELQDKPFITTTGIAGLPTGRMATEADQPGSGYRVPSDLATLALAKKDVRAMLVRLPPTVHGAGDHGFVKQLARIAREKKVAGYVGGNRWAAVHRLDVGVLYRLALESGTAGSIFHAVAESGVPMKTIAEALGRQLDVPATLLTPEEANANYTWLSRFFTADLAATSQVTRKALGWSPVQPGLVDDIVAGLYT